MVKGEKAYLVVEGGGVYSQDSMRALIFQGTYWQTVLGFIASLMSRSSPWRASLSGRKSQRKPLIQHPPGWMPLRLECELARRRTAIRSSNGAIGTTVLAVALLTGCEHKAPPLTPPPPKVSVITLQTQSVPISTELPGRVAGYRTADVRPQVNGIILKRLFVEGSDVKAGQQLYQIDPAPYQASYDSAVAADASARALAERYKPLVEASAVSKQDYDNAVASHLQAQADRKSVV